MSSSQNNIGSQTPRTIAVLSGKGGSGKTMLVAVMAQMFSKKIGEVIILDADTATAGMTYYLALKWLENIRVGLSNVAIPLYGEKDAPLPHEKEIFSARIQKYIQPIKGFERARFFGIGDHRRLERDVPQSELPSVLATVISKIKELSTWVFIDCRGGIDDASLAVCQQSDDVILICESDTTSFQATKHIVDVLSDHDQAFKVRGFIINKVFDDPTVLINQGTGIFGTQFLAAIPFDFRATRSFLKGNIPDIDTPFGLHVMASLNRAYPDLVQESVRTFSIEEYREIGPSNLDSRRGGIFTASIIMMLTLLLALRYIFSSLRGESFVMDGGSLTYFLLAFLTLGFLGSFDGTRRLIGKSVSSFLTLLSPKD